VVITEDQAVPLVRRVIEHGSIVYADEAASWDALHAFYDARRINHSIAFHDEGGHEPSRVVLLAPTPRRDRAASPDRRSPAPVRGRDDNRRKPNGTQFMNAAGAALGSPVSRSWCGY
jgi:hypothetical protein